MATVCNVIEAPSDEVFALLANGWRYADWVVGAKRIRAVDEGWPAVGSRFHHTVGVGPLTIHDTSEVLENEPGKRLVLDVRIWPTGRAKVSLELSPTSAGTRVRMDEVPEEGLAQTLDSPAIEALIWLRNTEALRRMRRAVLETRLARNG